MLSDLAAALSELSQLNFIALAGRFKNDDELAVMITGILDGLKISYEHNTDINRIDIIE